LLFAFADNQALFKKYEGVSLGESENRIADSKQENRAESLRPSAEIVCRAEL